jgi:hypothetical protein
MPEGTEAYTTEYVAGPDALVVPDGHAVRIRCGADETVRELPTDPPEPRVIIDSLLHAIRGEGSVAVSGEDGRVALGVSLAAIQSIENGATVALDRIFGARQKSPVLS